MKLRYLKILKSIVSILLIWSVLSFIVSIPLMNIDFPCFQRYYEYEECIAPYGNLSESTKFESFLSTYYAYAFGGGCAHYETAENDFRLNTEARDLKIKLLDGQISVDRTVLNKKDSFSYTDYFGLNFWTISFVKFTYVGNVPYCETNSTLKRHVIIGSYGTELSLFKGFLILSILIISFIYLRSEIKKVESVSVDKKIGFFKITKLKLVLTLVWIVLTVLLFILGLIFNIVSIAYLAYSLGIFLSLSFMFLLGRGFVDIFIGITLLLLQILLFYLISCIVFYIFYSLKEE